MKKIKNIARRMLSLMLVLVVAGCGNKTIDNSSVSEIESVSSGELILEEEVNSSSEQETTIDETKSEVGSDVTTDTADESAKAESEEESRKAEEERRSSEEESKSIAEEERRSSEEESKSIAEEESRKAEEEKQRAEQERIEQLNSFSMMYYLAITAEEIRTSKDNRLLLDEIYTSLLNDINPGAVDEITQDHLKNLRDILKSYIQISIKRERLQFLYNQEKAAAIRSAIPNPIAVLSTVKSLNWKQLAISVAYAAVDSVSNYKNAKDSADKNFLMSGWELDDEELATIQKNRDRAFDYMVDMVQEYNLDGLKTLNEKAVEKYAEICAIESTPERIKRLEAEKDTYELLGNYWLELAECYFEIDQYEKCLEAVEEYNGLSVGIYRQDYNYVKILPKAIVAAQNVYTDNLYVDKVSAYAEDLMTNTASEDWSNRYFVAQVYLDLYSRTNIQKYLKAAYDIAYDNVTVLLQNQRDINQAYLEDVKEVVIEEPDYKYMSEEEKKVKKQAFKEEQKRAKEYNKVMKEARKTELPALYEPLVVNCELLFALADELDVSEEEKNEIEAILNTESNGIFLSKPINNAYSFNESAEQYEIVFSKDEIIIPANILTAEASILVTVTENGNSITFNDWQIKKVERKEESLDSFEAYFSSQEMKKHKWTADSKVTVDIYYKDAYERQIQFKFAVAEFDEHWYGDKVEFEKE